MAETEQMQTDTLVSFVWRRMKRSHTALAGLAIVVFMLFLAVAGPALAPEDYKEQVTDASAIRETPSAQAWMGRDALGRDILSRILYGAHLTLGAGILTVAIGIVFGGGFGLVSGYFGGWVDASIMRVADVMLALPDYLLALAVIAALGPSLSNAMIAVGIAFVPKFARIVRASSLQQGGLDYVHSARTLGAGHVRILKNHVLPNCLAPLLVISTLSLGTAILYTSALSFLGLGAQPPDPEWGRMLADGKDAYLQAPHIVLFPGLMIALAVLGINLLGDGLRDALDVRL